MRDPAVDQGNAAVHDLTPQPPSETIVENLHAWAEITDLCLMLRRAVLARTVPEEQLDTRLFAEIREWKERQWRTTPP